MKNTARKMESKVQSLEAKSKESFFGKFLNGVEVVGNRMPHPVTIFIMLSIAVILISEIAARTGVTVTYYDAKAKKDAVVGAVSLLNAEGLHYMFTHATSNFTSFAPLGTVLVAMLGVGVAEGTGLISAAIKRAVLGTPKQLITAVVVFAGIMSNVASNAGYVVLVPLGAIVFLSFKRHPIAGLAAAFAGVSGGFSANLILGTIDPLLSGITNEALKITGSDVSILPTANLYFMMASTVLLTVIGTWVTEKIVEPRLGEYKGTQVVEEMTVSEAEKKGLKAAGLALLVLTAVALFMTVPETGMLRVDGSLASFIKKGLVPLIMIFFLVPGLAFGMASGTIKNDKHVVKYMTKAMQTMGGYLVLAFFAAQFIKYFSHTKLGIILAVSGANFLKSIGLQGLPLVLGFIVVAAFLNLFISSGSAKWGIMAPIFVPMLMMSGINPELTQLAYRIGDSTTNIITPVMSYFAVIVTFAQKYDEDAGIGTLISSMLPYSVFFMLGWTVMLILWYFSGMPIGPGAFMS